MNYLKKLKIKKKQRNNCKITENIISLHYLIVQITQNTTKV